MVSDMHGGTPRHRSVNACLFPLYAADGKHVVTVEGERLTVSSSMHACMHVQAFTTDGESMLHQA